MIVSEITSGISGRLLLTETEKGQEISGLSWRKDGKDIRVFRFGENLSVSIINSTTGDVLRTEGIPSSNHTTEELIDNLRLCEPEVHDDLTISFKKRTKKSLVDPNTIISFDRWSITLVDSSRTDSSSPLSWGGHAALLIEGMKDNYERFIWRAHLTEMEGKPGVGYVKLEEDASDKIEHIAYQSDTWLCNRADVERMNEEIDKEREQDPEHPRLLFDKMGAASLFIARGANLPRSQVHNCFTWAVQKLNVAGISLVIHSKFESIITPRVPRLLIDQISINLKKVIKVAVTLNGFSWFSGDGYIFDVTEDFHKKMHGKIWQTLSNDPIVGRITVEAEEGRDDPLQITREVVPVWSSMTIGDRIRVPVSTEEERFTGKVITGRVVSTVLKIPVKVQGEGVQNIDVTENLRQRIYQWCKEIQTLRYLMDRYLYRESRAQEDSIFVSLFREKSLKEKVEDQMLGNLRGVASLFHPQLFLREKSYVVGYLATQHPLANINREK